MMGTVHGVNGINGGHELGHKTGGPFKFFMAFSLTTLIQNHVMTYQNVESIEMSQHRSTSLLQNTVISSIYLPWNLKLEDILILGD